MGKGISQMIDENQAEKSLVIEICEKIIATGLTNAEFSRKYGIAEDKIGKLLNSYKKGDPQKSIGFDNLEKLLKAFDLLKTHGDNDFTQMDKLKMDPPIDFFASKELRDKYEFLEYLIPALLKNNKAMIEQAISFGFEEITGKKIITKENGTQQGGDRYKVG